MCGDCWNAAMAAPTAAVAARFAWVGYKDRLPFLGRGGSAGETPAATPEDDPIEELVDAGAPPP